MIMNYARVSNTCCELGRKMTWSRPMLASLSGARKEAGEAGVAASTSARRGTRDCNVYTSVDISLLLGN